MERWKKILDRDIATEYKYFVLIKNNFNDVRKVRQSIFCAGFHSSRNNYTENLYLLSSFAIYKLKITTALENYSVHSIPHIYKVL